MAGIRGFNVTCLIVAAAFLLGTFAGYMLVHRVHNEYDALPSVARSPRFRCTQIADDQRLKDQRLKDQRLKGQRAVGGPPPKDDSEVAVYEAAADLVEPKSTRSADGDLDLLLPGLVDNVVHYLWCERKIFEFQHYLSVLSVVRAINPERIIFHYGHYPRHDVQLYNTWFEDMKREFPYIDLDDLGSDSPACATPTSQKDYIIKLLFDKGGIYVHFNTVFLGFPFRYRRSLITDALSDGVEGFLVVHKGTPFDGVTVSDRQKTRCPPADEYVKHLQANDSHVLNASDVICVVKKGPYHPRDAWNKADAFSRAVNLLMYNVPETPKAKPSNASLIPNIGHVIWIGGGQMSFLFYLNCLSQLNIVKVDTLYVHGDVEPSGEYWTEIKAQEKVVFVKIVKPDLIFRKNIKVINHMADVYRVNILARYGGIYTDSDAVWIKPIPDEVRQYDAVASYDWPQMYNVYPDYIQTGVLLGKPAARYWNLVLDTFKDFRDDIYGYNGLLRPYKLLERHPDILYIYDKLQVMCWNMRCHPTWYPDFRDPNADHRRYSDFNWLDAHAFHWTYPTPDELMNRSALLASNTMFAEVGKHVMKAAGKL